MQRHPSAVSPPSGASTKERNCELRVSYMIASVFRIGWEHELSRPVPAVVSSPDGGWVVNSGKILFSSQPIAG